MGRVLNSKKKRKSCQCFNPMAKFPSDVVKETKRKSRNRARSYVRGEDSVFGGLPMVVSKREESFVHHGKDLVKSGKGHMT